jgi:hypothetical protein
VIGGLDLWLGADGVAAEVDKFSGGSGRSVTNSVFGDTGELVLNGLVGAANAAVAVAARSGLTVYSGGRLRWRWGLGSISDADAQAAYAAIRESTSDVEAIARYSGYKPERLQRIKDYLFSNAEFDADGLIAATWHRLRTGPPNAIDRMLLKHETAEMWLRNRGFGYSEAHWRVNQRWNWAKLAEER